VIVPLDMTKRPYIPQQNVCAMVAGRQSIKYIYPTTFSHSDSGGFEKPPLRKHKRYQQGLNDLTIKHDLRFFRRQGGQIGNS
jgi:hypothetical protein